MSALMAVRAIARIPEAGAAAWTPASLGSDLALWLDADDAGTITLTSGTVSQWDDKSGNGRHASTTTAADRPSSVANVQNGRAVMRFDSDRLNASVAANTFDNGIQISLVMVKTGTAFTNEALPALRTASNLGRGYDRYNAVIVNNAAGSTYTSTVNLRTATSWMVLSSRTNASGANEWKDGTSVLSSTTAYAYQDTATQMQFGRRADGVTAFRGDVGEIVVTQFLSTDNRQKLEGYLAHRWGLSGNLPGDHPYKSAAP